MIYKNVEFFNVAELIELEDGSVTWRRVPKWVEDTLERGDQSLRYSRISTGVELRFVLKSDQVTIRLAKVKDDGVDNSFCIFRGGFQGYYSDYAKGRVLTDMEPMDVVIKKHDNPDRQGKMMALTNMGWDMDVFRIRFDRGLFRVVDIIGDVEPPKKEQCPQKTLMTYGSSITVGMDALTAATAWTSVLSHKLQWDLLNKGFAGSCMLEYDMAEYLAQLGEQNAYDAGILELGINAMSYPEEKVYDRVENILRQVVGRNPDKPFFVVSPFLAPNDWAGDGENGRKWRRIIPEVVEKLSYPNLTYINGRDIVNDVDFFAADGLHPSVYGHFEIAQNMYNRVKGTLL